MNQKMMAAMGKSQRRSMLAENSFLSTGGDSRNGSVKGGLGGSDRRGSGVFYENKKEVVAARKVRNDEDEAQRGAKRRAEREFSIR